MNEVFSFQQRKIVVIRSQSHKYGFVFYCDNNHLTFFRQWEPTMETGFNGRQISIHF